MNKAEFDVLTKTEPSNIITLDMLSSNAPRTLIYGYTCSRETFHLYVKNGLFNLLVYKERDPVSGDVLESWSKDTIDLETDYFLPAKRIYPEACDYEFCQILIKAGKTLPFTTWSDDRPDKEFHGAVMPLVSATRVHRFSLVAGDYINPQTCIEFTSEYSGNPEEIYKVTSPLREKFKKNLHGNDEEFLFSISLKFQSGLRYQSGYVNDVETRYFTVERHRSVAENKAAVNEIVAYIKEQIS